MIGDLYSASTVTTRAAHRGWENPAACHMAGREEEVCNREAVSKKNRSGLNRFGFLYHNKYQGKMPNPYAAARALIALRL
jgi:hypothetical protein